MNSSQTNSFDVVIVGGGIAGALIAKQLGFAGKKVDVAGAAACARANFFVAKSRKLLSCFGYSAVRQGAAPGGRIAGPSIICPVGMVARRAGPCGPALLRD